MTHGDIHISPGLEALAMEGARIFIQVGQQAIAKDACFRVALSGGKTPQALYEALSLPPAKQHIRWDVVHFFFGDERCVPPDHQESNFRMANHTLFQPLNIPSEQIFRMEGELSDTDTAAVQYEQRIMNHFKASPPSIPRFHLIILGIGEDGHTASIFPQSPALEETHRLVVPSESPKGISQRMTFTLPLINQAEMILVLVSGQTKAPIMGHLFSRTDDTPSDVPAGLIRPVNGRLCWLLDQDSAKALC